MGALLGDDVVYAEARDRLTPSSDLFASMRSSRRPSLARPRPTWSGCWMSCFAAAAERRCSF